MKYKVIKSAAHNFGHSFASTLNYREGDYVMSHIARAVLATGARELQVNLLTGEASPPELLPQVVRDAIASRIAWFPDLLSSHGIPMSVVSSATMLLRFMPEKRSDIQYPDAPPTFEFPFVCEVKIVDDRSKQHVGIVNDSWWVEERPWSPSENHRWWQFWKRAV
ncbi:MAG: hypothetical protein M3362_22465 [Acidobacteriota bacterium]|nr:hypothetical protein [Acidobacteriota bacterium]